MGGHVANRLEPACSMPMRECWMPMPGAIVAPGFIDMHVHLREPGIEHAGNHRNRRAPAAAAGGFTTASAACPNTQPVNRQRHRDQLHRAARARKWPAVNVFPDRRHHQEAAWAKNWRLIRIHARQPASSPSRMTAVRDECAGYAACHGTGADSRYSRDRSLRGPESQRGRGYA